MEETGLAASPGAAESIREARNLEAGADINSGDPQAAPGHGDAEGQEPAPLLTNIPFLKLWLAQILSATGDWLGLVAITALAARVGGQAEGVAIGLVLSARIAPGFILGPLAGVFADRWDRRRILVGCDVGRALVLLTLPFVDTVLGLVLASLVLEMFTLLWSPAKEASVPDIVPESQLAAANSLSVAAAYGTFPVGAGLYALLANLAGWIEDVAWLNPFRLDQAGCAFVVDAFTFLAAAVLLGSLKLPRRVRKDDEEQMGVVGGLKAGLSDLREGWRFVFISPVIRAVNLGLATGLIGGGMLVPLGPVFVEEVLGQGEDGFGFLIFALGIGMALGVASVAALQKHIPKQGMFEAAVFGAGLSLLAATMMTQLRPAAILIGALGLCAGAVYVLGFTLLHEKSAPELRGRIFGALFMMVRACVLFAFVIGPLLSNSLEQVSQQISSDGQIDVFGSDFAIPGVRLTLWLAGFIIIGAGFVSRHSLRSSHGGEGGAADAGLLPVDPDDEDAPMVIDLREPHEVGTSETSTESATSESSSVKTPSVETTGAGSEPRL